MTITKKTRLLPPPFIGTRIKIRLDDPESLDWGMKKLVLAEGCEKAIINWGDGTSTELTNDGEVMHTYAETGEYEVRISDNIAQLQCSTISAVSLFYTAYTPKIREFHTTASQLLTLNNCCFNNAVNLHTFNCKGSGLSELSVWSFGKCAALVGRLDFPAVVSLASETFNNSPNVAELHFAKANEETISSLSGFQKKFGAENATVSFDL